MSTLYLPMFSRHRAAEIRRYNDSEQIIEQVHKRKLAAIENADKKAHNLKRVLEKNHLSIEINNATGNKHEPITRPN